MGTDEIQMGPLQRPSFPFNSLNCFANLGDVIPHFSEVKTVQSVMQLYKERFIMKTRKLGTRITAAFITAALLISSLVFAAEKGKKEDLKPRVIVFVDGLT